MNIQHETAIVTEAEALRAANKYLALEVGITFSATDPVLIPMKEPIWQFSIRFRLPGRGTLAMLGTIDVNANTHAILPLSRACYALFKGSQLFPTRERQVTMGIH